MRKLVDIIASLLLVAMFATSSLAHASEPVLCHSAPVAEAKVHDAEREPPAPGEQGTAVFHHHGACHAHQPGIATGVTLIAYLPRGDRVMPVAGALVLAVASPDAALRPPIA